MILRAGFALKTVGSLVNGLIPLRALVAGFLMTTNLAMPGTRKAPAFFSSLWPISASDSITVLTSLRDNPLGCASAIFWMSSDFDISLVAIFSPFWGESAK